jgi:hypothetical protein
MSNSMRRRADSSANGDSGRRVGRGVEIAWRLNSVPDLLVELMLFMCTVLRELSVLEMRGIDALPDEVKKFADTEGMIMYNF